MMQNKATPSAEGAMKEQCDRVAPAPARRAPAGPGEPSPACGKPARAGPSPTVFIVDDDLAVREATSMLFDVSGVEAEAYVSAEAFLASFSPERPGCLVLDIDMPGMSGLALQEELNARGRPMPIIFVTGHGDASTSVQAVKRGAVDLLRKPYTPDVLLARVQEAFEEDARLRRSNAWRAMIQRRFSSLTIQEREIVKRLATGDSVEKIPPLATSDRQPADSSYTHIMAKLQVQTLSELIALSREADRLDGPVRGVRVDSKSAPPKSERTGSCGGDTVSRLRQEDHRHLQRGCSPVV